MLAIDDSNNGSLLKDNGEQVIHCGDCSSCLGRPSSLRSFACSVVVVDDDWWMIDDGLTVVVLVVALFF